MVKEFYGGICQANDVGTCIGCGRRGETPIKYQATTAYWTMSCPNEQLHTIISESQNSLVIIRTS